MLSKFRVCSLVGLLVATVGGSAEAVMLQGEFSKTGVFEPFRCDGGVCVAATLSTATSVDITQIAGVPTPGVPGPVVGGSATGDFLALGLNGALGTMRDFTFSGAGSAAFPTAPIASFEVFGAIPLTFNLLTVALVSQGTNFLLLSGTGIFIVPGFDPTPGTFFFSGQTAGGASFSFSASQAATGVPEPASMMLFGTALFAFAARRRFSRK